jgi:hypothetical protein
MSPPDRRVEVARDELRRRICLPRAVGKLVELGCRMSRDEGAARILVVEPIKEGAENARIGEGVKRPTPLPGLLPLRLVVLDPARRLERELETLIVGSRWLDVDGRGLLCEDPQRAIGAPAVLVANPIFGGSASPHRHAPIVVSAGTSSP